MYKRTISSSQLFDYKIYLHVCKSVFFCKKSQKNTPMFRGIYFSLLVILPEPRHVRQLHLLQQDQQPQALPVGPLVVQAVTILQLTPVNAQ